MPISLEKNIISCSDCMGQWKIWCPYCKKTEFTHRSYTDKSELKKKVQQTKTNKIDRIKKIIPIQPTPITIENFFINTFGIFKEIKEISPTFNSFFKSKGSEYFTNADNTELIRVSDHWGYNIRFCSWHLEGIKRISCYNWQKEHGRHKRIGQIMITDLVPNNHNQNQVELISRHPY